ncbi:MAG: hypothetical protein HKN29_12095 [Rhodothermales bacterium]|nr:hypothetical protein [Rhodothermales bacterium]
MARLRSGNPVSRWFIGFFGSLILVSILPKTVSLLIRRMAGRVLAEALAIVLLGFLSNRLPPRSGRRW